MIAALSGISVVTPRPAQLVTGRRVLVLILDSMLTVENLSLLENAADALPLPLPATSTDSWPEMSSVETCSFE